MATLVPSQRPVQREDQETVRVALEQLRALETRHNNDITALRRVLRSLLSIDFPGTGERDRQTKIRFGYLRPDGSPFEGDVPYPDPKRVQTSFNEEHREAILILQEQNPEIPLDLLLVAMREGDEDGQREFSAAIRAIDGSGLVTTETYVDEGENAFGTVDRSTPEKRSRVIGYRPFVGEAAVEVPILPYDDVQKSYGERLALVQAGNAKLSPCISGTDRHLYAGTVVHTARHRGQLPDPSTVTIFDADKSCKGRVVPRGRAVGGRVDFNALLPTVVFGGARFRRWVGGEVMT